MWGSIVIKLWGEKGRNPQRIQAEAYMSGIYHLKQCCGGGGGHTMLLSVFQKYYSVETCNESDQ